MRAVDPTCPLSSTTPSGGPVLLVATLLAAGALLPGCFHTDAVDKHTGDTTTDSHSDDSGEETDTSGETDTDSDTETDSDTDSDTDTDTGGNPTPPPPSSPVVVVLLVDTIGELAADEVGYCAALQDLTAKYGLDVDCRGGGVAPASWTLESTLRIGWPKHNTGARIASVFPDCDDDPGFARLAHAMGGRYAFGADNAQINDAFDRLNCDGDTRSSWSNGADAVYSAEDDLSYAEQIAIADQYRAARLAMEDALTWAEEGGPVFAYLNNFEGGGHSPRCFEDPTTPACDATWGMAVDAGLTASSADRVTTFEDIEFWSDLFAYARIDETIDPPTLRETFWDTTIQSASHFRDDLTLPRLEFLLDNLQRMGRLDDLQLVVLGDHGESPCSDVLVRDGRDCSHGAGPNDWTSRVPAWFVPASMGRRWEENGWIGDADTPWSTSLVPYALFHDYGEDIPEDWPEPYPLGSAVSLTCFDQLALSHQYGLAVYDDVSVRCEANRCGRYEWRPMTDEHDAPEEVRSIPAWLNDFLDPSGQYPNWFVAACEGAAPE